jgi:hypothetical protein
MNAAVVKVSAKYKDVLDYVTEDPAMPSEDLMFSLVNFVQVSFFIVIFNCFMICFVFV